MPEIVISEFMDEAAIHASFAGRDVLYDPKLVDDSARLIAAVRDARALIVRNRTQVRGSLLESAARLQVVGRLGVGLDNIDVPACEARGIAVFPATLGPNHETDPKRHRQPLEHFKEHRIGHLRPSLGAANGFRPTAAPQWGASQIAKA